MDSQSLTRYFPASRLTVTATLMLSLTALTRPANAAFILQFSELETNDNGSLFADTIAAKGSPVGPADISDPTKTPYGIVLSAPGTQPTSLPGYIPRLCGNENGNISGIAVSTTCRVSIELAPNAIAQADDLKAGIAYLVEPPGQPDAGDVSDSLQVVLGAGDVATGRRSSIDFFWKSDPSVVPLLRNCNVRMNETGDYQDVGTFAQLNANGNGCVANTTFKLPANNLFSVQVSSDLETPEPGVAGLVGLGLAGIALLRKRST